MDTLGGRHETHWSSHKYAHYVVENSCAQSVKLSMKVEDRGQVSHSYQPCAKGEALIKLQHNVKRKVWPGHLCNDELVSIWWPFHV